MSEHPQRPTAVPPGSTPVGSRGSLAPGTIISGRYRLDTPIASGGMATVWRAVDTVLTRPVAVKVLHQHLAADPDFVTRFRREAVAAARLAHPNIVAIYDTSADPEAIVMELVDGRTLRDELDSRGFVPPEEAVAIVSGICQALDVAHRAGIVHRDVKPANVLLAGDGRLKVADFGIAKAAAELAGGDPDLPDVTAIGLMVGTAKYLSPEQVSGGTVDARSDVYAVGALLYEMVCGRAPFSGENDLAVATARLHADPEHPRAVLRTLPPRLDDIIMKALERDPDRRYPSASALWADLQSCPTGESTPPTPEVDETFIGEGPSFTKAERSWLVPAGLVSLTGLALVLAWLLIGGTEVRREFFDLVDRVPVIGDRAPAEALTATARSFDPLGDGREHDDRVRLVVDGDAGTSWRTERYQTRSFGGLKAGVGVMLDLGATARLSEAELFTANAGWSATIHVADRPAATIEEWGAPIANVSDGAAGSTRLELGDARGSYVLVWLTDLGSDPRVIFELGEVTVRGR